MVIVMLMCVALFLEHFLISLLFYSVLYWNRLFSYRIRNFTFEVLVTLRTMPMSVEIRLLVTAGGFHTRKLQQPSDQI